MNTRTLTLLACLLAGAPCAIAQDGAPIVELLTEDRLDPLNVPTMDTPEGLLARTGRGEALMLDETSIALLSELQAAHGRDALLARALFMLETGERGVVLAERFLDDDTLDDATADRIAVALEVRLPLIAARGAALASSVTAPSEPEESVRLAGIAWAYAEACASDSALALLTRGHALRLLGREAEALESFEAVPDAIERRRSLHDRAYRREAALGAALALAGSDASPAREALEHAARTLRDADHPETSVLIADVAYAIAGDHATPELHLALFDRFLHSNPPGQDLYVLNPSLAEIGERMGGVLRSERVPAECLLAIGVRGSGAERRALGIALDEAERVRADRPGFWAYTAFMFATLDAPGEEDDARRVRTMLDLLEIETHRSWRVTLVSGLRSANAQGMLTAPERDRWVAMLRSRDRALPSPRSEREDRLADLALLEELERRVNATNARRIADEASVVLNSESGVETHYALLRVLGAALRLAEGVRTDLAQRALERARVVRSMREGQDRSVFDRTRAWDVYGADALCALGRYDEALEMLAAPTDRSRNGGFAGRAYDNSARRVRLHAHAMSGAYDEASRDLEELSRRERPAFLLPGTPFRPEPGLGARLASTFVGDAHEPTARDLAEARYALVRDRFAQRHEHTRDDGACLDNTAILIRAGFTDDAIGVLDACGADDTQARLLRAEALFRARNFTGAFAIYRDLARTLGVTAERRATREHWHAWARMLEILRNQNADGSRTEQIHQTVRRLKALPSWGEWPEAVARIEAVAQGVED